MSAKDLKTRAPSGGRRRQRDANVAETHSARAPDIGELARAGLKIYRFDVSAASGTALPFQVVRRIKEL